MSTYEQNEESYLQAVGARAWDAGVEAGEWIQFGWQKMTGTLSDAYGAASQWVDDAVYTPAEFAEDTRTAVEKGLDNVTDVVKDALDGARDIADKVVDEGADTVKAIPYLVAGVGGLAIYLHYSNKRR